MCTRKRVGDSLMRFFRNRLLQLSGTACKQSAFGASYRAMNMPKSAVVFGTLLIITGVGGYMAATSGGQETSPTALIPAGLGLVIALSGFIGMAFSKARMHVMHIAALAALLGIAGPLVRLIISISEEVSAIALVSNVLTLAFSGIFLALCIKSFIDARRSRTAGAQG